MIDKLIALSAFVLLTAGAAIAHAADDLAGLSQEATQLAGEKKNITEKLEQNLQVKRKNDGKLEKLENEAANIKVVESQLDARRPGVNSLCHRTVPKEQYAAAEAQCDAVRIPFNKEVDTLNARSKENVQQIVQAKDDDKARAAEEKEITARGKEIEQRLAAVRNKISLLLRDSALQCMKNCGSGSGRLEVGAYCLQKCWDRAAGGLPPVERTEQYQAQFGSRTAEQAIEEYRKSGPAYIGPKMGPIKEPPLPPK